MRTRVATVLAILAAAGAAVLFIENPLSAQSNTIDVAVISLEIEGKPAVHFDEVVSLSSEVVGTPSNSPRDVAAAPSAVTLRRHIDNNLVLWEWQKAVRADPWDERRAAQLVFYNVDGKPVTRYHLEMAWPAKIQIGALKAGASEVLMETIVIQSESIDRVEP